MFVQIKEFLQRYFKLVLWINLLWSISMTWIAVIDSNWGFVIWFVVWFLLGLIPVLVTNPFPYSGIWSRVRPVWEFFEDDVHFRMFFIKLLPVFTLGLFFIGFGPFGNPQTAITLESKLSSSVRVIDQQGITLHIPILEKVEVWPADYTFARSSAVFTTADQHNVVATIEVQVSRDGSVSAPALLERYGSASAYREEFDLAILAEFQRVVGQYTIEQIALQPSLLLEDHIGTNLGLEPFGLRWSGVIKVTNLHATAEQP